MTTGIPNEVFLFGMPLAGLTALIPFYLALSKCRNYREAGLITSLFAGLIHILSSFWLANFKEYALLTIGASSAFYFITGWFAGQLLYIPFSFSTFRNGTRRFSLSGRVLFFSCFWTVLEWLKSNGILAYPWGTLILTAWKWKILIQIAAVTGTWGISFLFSLFASTAAEGILLLPAAGAKKKFDSSFFTTPFARTALFTALLFTITLTYGTIEYLKPRYPVKTLNTVLVQHNGDSWEDSEEKCIETAASLTEKAISTSELSPDLAVWSEGILTFALPDSWWYYDLIPEEQSLQESIRNTGIPFIIGAPYVMDADLSQVGNCAVLIDENAVIQDHYAKIHLVPFAEGIPFEDTAWMQKFMQTIAGFSHGWKAGKEYKTFTVTTKNGEQVKLTSPVCFEDAFPDVCRKLYLSGSEVFMNITNDSWSLKKSSEYQHYVISSYRAIENRTTLVRVTNGGFTSVTDPAGRILTGLPLFEEDSILAEVPIFERATTPYATMGDWLPLLAGVIIFLYFFYFMSCQRTFSVV